MKDLEFNTSGSGGDTSRPLPAPTQRDYSEKELQEVINRV